MNQAMAMVAAVLLVLPGALRAQDYKETQEPKKADSFPQFQPGKEHQTFKQFEGDWEYKSRCTVPGKEAMQGQGNETCKVEFGGFWLELEDKGNMAGKEYTGKGLIGWDPHKKKYCGVWVDNMMPFMGRFEGDADASGKTFNFKMKSTEDMKNWSEEGKSGKYDESRSTKPENLKNMVPPERLVIEFKDPDHRTLRFYGKDDSGKEIMVSEITYTRKPAMVK